MLIAGLDADIEKVRRDYGCGLSSSPVLLLFFENWTATRQGVYAESEEAFCFLRFLGRLFP
jgi:hypothetical protein